MAGRNPAEALSAFIGPFRRAIRCVAHAEVLGSTFGVDVPGTITLCPKDGEPGNLILLRTGGHHRDILLGVNHDYTIVRDETPDRGPFKVRSTRYSYDILDAAEQEILIFQWHPEGVSRELTPHMHISGAKPIILAPRPSGVVPPKLDISNAHVMTGRVFLEDVLLLLIRDLGVEPVRDDAAAVLLSNLEAIGRGRTW